MTIWSEDDDRRIAELAANGCPASEIAVTLGWPSRNAVIGRARRKGIPLCQANRSNNRPRKPRAARNRAGDPKVAAYNAAYWRRNKDAADYVPRPRKKCLQARVARRATAARKLARLSDTPVQPLSLPLMALDANACRWPYGDENYRFCGHAKADERYCSYHAWLALRSSEDQTKAPDPARSRAVDLRDLIRGT